MQLSRSSLLEIRLATRGLAARRLQRIVDNLSAIAGIELMHAAQAIDLRLQANPSLPLGAHTRKVCEDFRRVVPFLDHDRVLTKDITTATAYERGRSPNWGKVVNP